MRLTAGSFRELHWHRANEWAYMLTGKARASCLQTNGKMFLDNVEAGDLWYFPAGLPHSIQGLEAPTLLSAIRQTVKSYLSAEQLQLVVTMSQYAAKRLSVNCRFKIFGSRS
jgi:cupin superfamily acireductone dioxygenase involved in methionine salvage